MSQHLYVINTSVLYCLSQVWQIVHVLFWASLLEKHSLLWQLSPLWLLSNAHVHTSRMQKTTGGGVKGHSGWMDTHLQWACVIKCLRRNRLLLYVLLNTAQSTKTQTDHMSSHCWCIHFMQLEFSLLNLTVTQRFTDSIWIQDSIKDLDRFCPPHVSLVPLPRDNL